MDEPGTFASLSPSLLARKGAAKPAMRPQVQPLSRFHESVARQLDVAPPVSDGDAGWNEHGDHDEATEPAPAQASDDRSARIVPINGRTEAQSPVAAPRLPEIVRQTDAIGARMAGEAPAHDAPARRSALARGGRAAFTLRLDAERHLRLRLACAVDNRSAQQIVTEALDRLIGEMPEIEALAWRARNEKAQKGDIS